MNSAISTLCLLIPAILLLLYLAKNISIHNPSREQPEHLREPKNKHDQDNDDDDFKESNKRSWSPSSVDEAVRRSFAARVATVARACEKYRGDQNWAVRTKVFSMEPRSGLVLCRTAKHGLTAAGVPGSTSWSNYLVRLYTRTPTRSSQDTLKVLEERAYSKERKRAVLAALEEPDHTFTAFFVCRNPVARLLSVYHYLMDGRRNRRSKMVWARPGRSDFQAKKPLSWPGFLSLVANSPEANYLGLLEPLYEKCAPCRLHYRAVVDMDTFDRDSGYLMRRAGLPLLTKPHLNNHGTSSLADSSVDKLFRHTSVEDIRRLISKFGKDFEICGYESTLSDLRRMADRKLKGKSFPRR